MSYLYLNFVENLEKGSKNWDDFYTSSLNEQYENIKRKLGTNIGDSLSEFINIAFPGEVEKKYYISMPSFDRRIKKNRFDKECIYNIVIRPEKDGYLKYVLPEKYDLILIGDVTFGKITEVTIKGIELIDSKVAKFGEERLSCSAACALKKKSIMHQGRTITVADYEVGNLRDTVLTNDFIYFLTNELYPVPNPSFALKTFKQWQNYIDFRKYYLGKQSERCEEIANVTICNSFMITKENFRRNEDNFSAYLLDGIEQFSKGEQVILSKEVNGADSFPLIRVDIEKNRKVVLSDTLGKNGKGKPKYEANLQRYTKESMGLSPVMPKYDEKGNMKGLKSYLLGERYLFTFIDVEPDLSELEKKFEKDYKAVCNEVDSRYAGIIANDLNHYLAGQQTLLTQKYNKQLDEYKSSLLSCLETDIAENKDKEINKQFDAEFEQRINPLKTELNRKKDKLNIEIKKIQSSKLSDIEKEKNIEELNNQLKEEDYYFNQKAEKIRASILLRDFYIARNEKWIENKKKSLAINMQSEIERLKNEKKEQLQVQYRQQIEQEKSSRKEVLQTKLDADKAEKIEEETIRRYQIYFRPDDANEKVKDLEKQIATIDAKYLTYDNRAEKAKIERQEKALNSLLGGYVKNPFLPTYLFAPETLAQSVREVTTDPEWCLESLNDRQKLAVKRALASESIFLLQGPPGTGKTQVIAEITAQLAKQGKKVLISSETHKAIDNVFERLPKIPEIMPLRLIPSNNGKETNYSPERLVDNFYLNICGNLKKQVKRFENFEGAKADFDEQMRQLRYDYDKVLRLKRANSKIENERNVLLDRINRLNSELEQIRISMTSIKEREDLFRRTIKYVENYRFESDGVDSDSIERYKKEVRDILLSFDCFKELPLEKVVELLKLDEKKVGADISLILSEDKLIQFKSRQQELRRKLGELRDPETDEAPEEGNVNYDKYKKYQAELKEVVNKIRNIQSENSFDLSENQVFALLPAIIKNKTLLKELPEQLRMFKTKLQNIIFVLKSDIEKELDKILGEKTKVADKINEKQIDISENKRSYEELSEDNGIEEYGELNSALKQKITRFFRDFDIIQEYDSDNLETAFKIISEEWNKIEKNYKTTQAENKVKIPMYKEIVKYLSQEDILEEDRQAYTRELFNCVNVFGITCTSRDRFTKSQLQELDKYGIESVDIRTQGIDVVIVDEVSKSSFLDLLIPILYGKTIILVGDHRQLPPMYDLRHMRENDFEGLDENIIDKKTNDGYTALYEECFFKTLYEKVPEEFRVMLNKQYRCHSHIMEVFNHFYGGNAKGLMVGKKQQDDEKEHGLTVKIKNSTILEPKNHICFVDCPERESSAYEGSTSKINEQEAQVAITLLKELDKSCNELVKLGKIRYNKEDQIDERPSVGVICTYGDQANLIKKKRKYQQFTGFSGKQDEKLVISTVDDFQGDERDIIIVSMVRNPAPGKKFDAEFIKKFERINVALSRARKLLIIVGSKHFLSEAGVIDLPDLEGRKELDKQNFHVYKEIIDTICFRGRVLTASDIIGE